MISWKVDVGIVMFLFTYFQYVDLILGGFLAYQSKTGKVEILRISTFPLFPGSGSTDRRIRIPEKVEKWKSLPSRETAEGAESGSPLSFSTSRDKKKYRVKLRRAQIQVTLPSRDTAEGADSSTLPSRETAEGADSSALPPRETAEYLATRRNCGGRRVWESGWSCHPVVLEEYRETMRRAQT